MFKVLVLVLAIYSLLSLVRAELGFSGNGYSQDFQGYDYNNNNGNNGVINGNNGINGGNSEGRNGEESNGLGAIPGEPEKDYPIFSEPPETSFKCQDQNYPGYYADPEARCQVFHICQEGNRIDSFLCPNGTLFNQEFLVCVWWNQVDCDRARDFYSVNEQVFRAMQEATEKLMQEAARKQGQNGQGGYDYSPSQNSNGNNNYQSNDLNQGYP